MKRWVIATFLTFCIGFVFSQTHEAKLNMVQYEPPKDHAAIYIGQAKIIAKTLHKLRSPGPHLWKRALWWNSANIFEALLDQCRLTGQDPTDLCKQLYRKNHLRYRGEFKNWAFDDEAWWALAWIKAYDQTGEKKYLQVAEGVFADMRSHSWTDQCNGGANWMRKIHYKNAVTNELYITLAAKLAMHYRDDTCKNSYYLSNSLMGWKWLSESGIRNEKFLYNDGLDEHCQNNHGVTWTYNQGVILGGLKELYLLTGDLRLLDNARSTALATIQLLSNKDGILTEVCDGNCSIDGVQFKGIFIRYLSELNEIIHDPKISNYIQHNAEVMWLNAQDSRHRFDHVWAGPYRKWRGASTGVALDLINAAITQLCASGN